MTARHVLFACLAVGVGTSVGLGTYAAFTATTTNSGNSFASGTVAVEDNDTDAAMLRLTNAQPGDSDTSCIKIRYTGSLDSSVRLYASVSGGLAPYLTLTVTRGTDPSPSFDNCATFNPDLTNYIGAGNGVVYSGALSAFPSGYAGGIVDPAPSAPETWAAGEERLYRFVISLDDDTAAEGLSATAAFVWEARNL